MLTQEREYNENKELIDNKGSFTKELKKEKNLYLEKEKEKNECQNKLLEYYKENGSLEQKIKSLNEVKMAIKKIKNGENEIELSPQNSNIRRKQHFFATNEGVGSISIGEENKRRIVLKKRL